MAGKPEDRRYAEMLRRGSRPRLWMFLRVYLTQALIMWFVSLPVQSGIEKDLRAAPARPASPLPLELRLPVRLSGCGGSERRPAHHHRTTPPHQHRHHDA
ncbi:DUF1295 domain-containing protein [Saccharopolyspora shandongensis]|uniref:DUF1295 domain-containing protein n=1 Tax=Saccharopolyspora shandongensis TaxID=418495 RepID=UPI0033C384F9